MDDYRAELVRKAEQEAALRKSLNHLPEGARCLSGENKQVPIVYEFVNPEKAEVILDLDYGQEEEKLNYGVIGKLSDDVFKKAVKRYSTTLEINQASRSHFSTTFVASFLPFLFIIVATLHPGLLVSLGLAGFFGLVLGEGVARHERRGYTLKALAVRPAEMDHRVQTLLNTIEENLSKLEKLPVWRDVKRFPSVQRFDISQMRAEALEMARSVNYGLFHNSADEQSLLSPLNEMSEKISQTVSTMEEIWQKSKDLDPLGLKTVSLAIENRSQAILDESLTQNKLHVDALDYANKVTGSYALEFDQKEVGQE